MRLPTVPLPTLSVLTSIKRPNYWVMTIANWTTLLNLLVFNSPEALLAADGKNIFKRRKEQKQVTSDARFQYNLGQASNQTRGELGFEI